MIVTTLTANVAAAQSTDLTRTFERASADLPQPIREAFLLHQRDSDVWQIVAVWRSAEELATYRASVETPEGVRMFRSVGVEPTLAVFEVAGHATTRSEAAVK